MCARPEQGSSRQSREQDAQRQPDLGQSNGKTASVPVIDLSPRPPHRLRDADGNYGDAPVQARIVAPSWAANCQACAHLACVQDADLPFRDWAVDARPWNGQQQQAARLPDTETASR